MENNERVERAADMAASWWSSRTQYHASADAAVCQAALRTTIAAALRERGHARVDSYAGGELTQCVRVRDIAERLCGDRAVVPYNTWMEVTPAYILVKHDHEAVQRLPVGVPGLELQVKYTLLQRDIDNLISAAFCGGVNYWCIVDRVPTSPEWFCYVRTVDEPARSLVLNREKLLLGLERAARRYPKRFEEFMSETGDASTADVILQLALFDDVLYG